MDNFNSSRHELHEQEHQDPILSRSAVIDMNGRGMLEQEREEAGFEKIDRMW